MTQLRPARPGSHRRQAPRPAGLRPPTPPPLKQPQARSRPARSRQAEQRGLWWSDRCCKGPRARPSVGRPPRPPHGSTPLSPPAAQPLASERRRPSPRARAWRSAARSRPPTRCGWWRRRCRRRSSGARGRRRGPPGGRPPRTASVSWTMPGACRPLPQRPERGPLPSQVVKVCGLCARSNSPVQGRLFDLDVAGWWLHRQADMSICFLCRGAAQTQRVPLHLAPGQTAHPPSNNKRPSAAHLAQQLLSDAAALNDRLQLLDRLRSRVPGAAGAAPRSALPLAVALCRREVRVNVAQASASAFHSCSQPCPTFSNSSLSTSKAPISSALTACALEPTAARASSAARAAASARPRASSSAAARPARSASS